MTDRPDPPRDDAGGDGDRYSTRVESPSLEDHRRLELDTAGATSSNSDDKPEVFEAARQQLAGYWDTLDEFIRPEKYDIVAPGDDQYAGDTPFDFDAMACAYIYYFCKPSLSSWDALASHLEAHRVRDDYRDIPSNLGFGDDLPHADTFRNTWHERFQPAFRDHLIHLAHKTALQCRKYDIPISPDAFPTYGTDDEEPDPKEITADQKRTAIENIRPMVFSQLDFDRAENSTYDNNTFLDLYSEVSRETDYIEKTVQERWNEGEAAPFPQTVFQATENREADEWEDEFREVFEQEVQAAKGAGVFDRPVPVYIDTTIRPYYLRSAGLPEGARGGEPKNGTYYGYHHTTISAHVNGRSVLLASYQMTPDDTQFEAVEYLIKRAEEMVSLREVCMDSAFAGAKTLTWLDDRGRKFIVQRARRGKELKRKLAAMDGTHGEDTLRLTPHGTRESTKAFRLVAEPDYDEIDGEYVLEREGDSGQMGLEDYTNSDRKSIDLNEIDDRLWKGRRAYLTNIEDEDVESIINRYNRRWTIETKYRVIKSDFLGKTCSRKFPIRTFYWLFACMLYNAWVLLDVFLRADHPDLAPDDRPVMPAKSFAKQFLKTEHG